MQILKEHILKICKGAIPLEGTARLQYTFRLLILSRTEGDKGIG